MSPGESSRKGKPIARRACDLCRSRKLQCVFDQLVELPKLKPRVTILTTRIQRMKEQLHMHSVFRKACPR
ncbi:hypothetical protein FOWG_09136 [Fusarium oxysporum f. sp. lycopersici MN25]|nr:hypothetical protein FOWG_09136 [Fusarium oxysporum f. sp. lycopersici MN25]